MKVNQHIYKLLKQEAKKKNTYNIQKEINVRSFVNIKPFRKTIYSNLQREKILRNYCTKKKKGVQHSHFKYLIKLIKLNISHYKTLCFLPAHDLNYGC